MSTSSISVQEKARQQNIILDEPIIHPISADHLAFRCNELVFAWLKENAPENIYRLASLADVFDDYSKQLAEFEGQVSQDANHNVSDMLYETINLIGELDGW